MASLGSLVVSLGLDSAEFISGLTKAQYQSKKFADQAVKLGALFGTTLVAGAGAAAVAIDQLAKSAANFKDLEETTGASAEGLASIAVSAGIAGVSMEDVAGASIKLAKNLTGVGDESKAAGAAIAALGLNIADFKKLDPVQQVDALTKAFGSFADGQGKTAVAVALWGKAGAEQLKLMKALQEQGGRQVILTQAQIEQADRYADAQAEVVARTKLYAQSIVTEALPAINALVSEIGEAVKRFAEMERESAALGKNTAVRQFAEDAAIAIGGLVDEIARVGPDFKAFAASTRKEVAALRLAFEILTANPSDVGDYFLRNTGPLQKFRDELSKANDDVAKAVAERDRLVNGPRISDRLRFSFSDEGRAASRIGQDPLELARRGRPTAKPSLDFDGAIKTTKAKKEVDELAKSISDLEQELALFGQDDAFVKAFKLEGMGATNAQLDDYRSKLQQIKELRVEEEIGKTIAALVKERDAVGLTNEQLKIQELLLSGASEAQIQYAQGVLQATDAARKQAEAIEEGKRLTESLRTPIEEYNSRVEKYSRLLDAGAISQETFNRALQDARSELDSVDYSKAAESASATLERLRNAEERVNIERQSGSLGELEALARLGEERQKVIAQLEAQVSAQEAIARASGSDRLVLDAERARLELERLKATADPLGQLFEDIFTDSAASAFEDFISGAKSAEDAFKSFALSVVNEIARMAAQDLAKSLFGGLSGSGGGIGSLLGSIFGRAVGGPAEAGGLYRINENKRPEVLDLNGQQFLMMGNQRGRVIPQAPTGGRSVSVVQNFAITGPVDRRTQEQIASKAARSLQIATSRGTA
jgi:hypothetical protein